MMRNRISLTTLAIILCVSIGGGGSAAAQDALKGKKPKPQPALKCKDVERTCSVPGAARWCVCKDGLASRTVQCGCKAATTTGPSTPAGGSQTPARP